MGTQWKPSMIAAADSGSNRIIIWAHVRSAKDQNSGICFFFKIDSRVNRSMSYSIFGGKGLRSEIHRMTADHANPVPDRIFLNKEFDGFVYVPASSPLTANRLEHFKGSSLSFQGIHRISQGCFHGMKTDNEPCNCE
jgi:hypothetical protein